MADHAKPRVLVTAAAGKTGSAATLQLLQRGHPVRALVRRRDGRSERLARAGAELVVGSLEDWEDLQTSLAGVARAYFCPPLEPGTLRRATLFAAAAREARLEVVVALSQWLADPLHPAVHAREKWLSNRVFDWVPGVDVVTVQPGFFADNYMALLEPAAHFGLLALPLGEGLNAPPSNEDIARVVVGALTDPRRHVGKAYRPTGPALLAPPDIAAIMARVLGRPVRYQDAPTTLFLKAARSLGIAPFVIEELVWFLRDYRRNAFGIGAPTADVLDVGGSPPEDFETIVRRYVAADPAARRTPAARARAIANLMRALMTPAPDVTTIATRLALPALAHARLAADSTPWLESHDPAAARRPPSGDSRVARLP
jgi:NAD(P)H dehydrogenase (quinone)